VSPIGTTVKRKEDKAVFRVVGTDETSGKYVLAPVEHGENILASAKELRREFGLTDASDPERTDAQAGWDRLSERFRKATDKATRKHVVKLPSPEAVFCGQVESIAEQEARRIAQNPDLLAEVETGLRVVPEAVGRALDDLLKRPATPVHGAQRRGSRR
jgi:crotonobetainyl-CoA:carnitine CoA-transferase CaiB-like acyl-CoA transferase